MKKILNSSFELRTSNFLLLAVVVAGCATATTKEPSRPVDTGAVSAKLVGDPNAPGAHLAPGEEFTAPQLVPGNPTPAYPEALLPQHLPAHTVGVRIVFDERGAVMQIDPSPLVPSTDDRYRPQFEAAVRDAVGRWKCWPPRIRTFRPGPDVDGDGNPDYRILVSEKVLKTFFDVAFSFEIVEGKPVVRPAQSTLQTSQP